MCSVLGRGATIEAGRASNLRCSWAQYFVIVACGLMPTDNRCMYMTAMQVVMSVSFCLPHPVAVSNFIICRGLCACTEMM